MTSLRDLGFFLEQRGALLLGEPRRPGKAPQQDLVHVSLCMLRWRLGRRLGRTQRGPVGHLGATWQAPAGGLGGTWRVLSGACGESLLSAYGRTKNILWAP